MLLSTSDGSATWRTVNTPVMRTWHAVCMIPGGLGGWVVGQQEKSCYFYKTDLGGGRRVIDSGSYPEPYPLMVYLTGSSPRPTHPSEGSSAMLKTQDPPP